MKHYSLYELNNIVKGVIDDSFQGEYWVQAELSECYEKAGHCYLELVEKSTRSNTFIAKARAIIWADTWGLLRRPFEQTTGQRLTRGMKVLLKVYPHFHESFGFSWIVTDIDATYTIGDLARKRLEIIKQLQDDGVFDMNKQLELPLFCQRIAVVSSASAAGYGDFCRHLHENEFGFVFKTELFEAAMQGQTAPESITDALDRIESSPEQFDAVLILRGGGSTLDLACFDDYGLCWRIANCRIPVYTAIGHDRDYHVADMVAFSFVKTPTALADEFIGCFMAEDERISSFTTRLRLAFINKVNALGSRLDLLESRIRNADPRSILKRGYILAADSRGVVMKTASGVNAGDRITLMFSDGTLECEVLGKD